jgi:hypothetical protein
LTAIGCALPPDYSLSRNYDDEWYSSKTGADPDGPYNPQPINTSRYPLFCISLCSTISAMEVTCLDVTVHELDIAFQVSVIQCPDLSQFFNTFMENSFVK